VVVGYDGSTASREAVAYAARRVGRDGRLIVVHAYGPPRERLDSAGYQELIHECQQKGRRLLDELEGEGGTLARVPHTFELVGGEPAEELLQIAERDAAAEIVVGSRGLGPWLAAFGSVSHELLFGAERPVVVVPAMAREEVSSSREAARA
jgi:nucleotide-binding universal stress UspA family protein